MAAFSTVGSYPGISQTVFTLVLVELRVMNLLLAQGMNIESTDLNVLRSDPDLLGTFTVPTQTLN